MHACIHTYMHTNIHSRSVQRYGREGEKHHGKRAAAIGDSDSDDSVFMGCGAILEGTKGVPRNGGRK